MIIVTASHMVDTKAVAWNVVTRHGYQSICLLTHPGYTKHPSRRSVSGLRWWSARGSRPTPFWSAASPGTWCHRPHPTPSPLSCLWHCGTRWIEQKSRGHMVNVLRLFSYNKGHFHTLCGANGNHRWGQSECQSSSYVTLLHVLAWIMWKHLPGSITQCVRTGVRLRLSIDYSIHSVLRSCCINPDL